MSGSLPATTTPTDSQVVAADTAAEFSEVAAPQAATDTPDASATETQESLLDVVKNAANEGASPAPTDSAAKPLIEPPATTTAEAGGEAAGTTDEPDESLPFHKHPRWQKVLGERNEARLELDTLRPAAQQHNEMLGFMERNALAPADVQKGFAIMAALKNDPAAAWELMKPYVENVQAHLGHVLPDDLRQRVDDGLVDEDTARETARLRNDAALRAARAQHDAAASTQAEQDRRSQEAVEGVVTAVNAYVAGKVTDPDNGAIMPMLEGEILRLQRAWTAQRKPFQTPAAATELTNEAYEGLRQRLRPARLPSRNTPAGSQSPGGIPQPAATLKDAVLAAARI